VPLHFSGQFLNAAVRLVVTNPACPVGIPAANYPGNQVTDV
jgi:hypothetical protein